ncbi:MAG TPA: hypothetical protein PLP09_06855 [Petrotogaceae bacterium]|jgi:hypothetical protein|nr:hypothetical protein [Petrotogaceae bacterium]
MKKLLFISIVFILSLSGFSKVYTGSDGLVFDFYPSYIQESSDIQIKSVSVLAGFNQYDKTEGRMVGLQGFWRYSKKLWDGPVWFYYQVETVDGQTLEIIDPEVFSMADRNYFFLYEDKINRAHNIFGYDYMYRLNSDQGFTFQHVLEGTSFADFYFQTRLSLNSPFFQAGSQLSFGIQTDLKDFDPYILFSGYGALGNRLFNIGYKNTAYTGSGDYLKYFTPLNSIRDRYFMLTKDFAFSDKVKKQLLLSDTESYSNIPAVFLNLDFPVFTGGARVYDLQPYRKISLANKYGYDLFAVVKNEGFFFGGQWLSENIKDLNYFSPINPPKYNGDFVVLTAGYNDNVVNTVFYDYTQFYSVAMKTLFKLNTSSIYDYFVYDHMHKIVSMYLTHNWQQELYAMYSFSGLYPSFFVDFMVSQPFGEIILKALGHFTYDELLVNKFGTNTAFYYKLGVQYSSGTITTEVSGGNTSFFSVWDGWGIKEEDPSRMSINLSFKHSI